LREIAREFYDELPHHDSWVQVLYDFIFDPEIGPYARIKRKHRDELIREKEFLANKQSSKVEKSE